MKVHIGSRGGTFDQRCDMPAVPHVGDKIILPDDVGTVFEVTWAPFQTHTEEIFVHVDLTKPEYNPPSPRWAGWPDV
jgi:hypothetical protein